MNNYECIIAKKNNCLYKTISRNICFYCKIPDKINSKDNNVVKK